jgi:hypothetical protein
MRAPAPPPENRRKLLDRFHIAVFAISVFSNVLVLLLVAVTIGEGGVRLADLTLGQGLFILLGLGVVVALVVAGTIGWMEGTSLGERARMGLVRMILVALVGAPVLLAAAFLAGP